MKMENAFAKLARDQRYQPPTYFRRELSLSFGLHSLNLAFKILVKKTVVFRRKLTLFLMDLKH